ncbi:MAG: hypothetical protein H6797_01170 [Candidatus Nomurabacteria bacterium]|nr:MAG: hypothetical protein H6797_01170 [Candidatus Nomurabacteria bacterium]
MTPQLYTLTKAIRTFFVQHHTVIVVSAIGLLLSYATFTLYQITLGQPEPTNVPTSTIDKFDEDTVNKIKALRDSGNDKTTLKLPSPRPNPFVE